MKGQSGIYKLVYKPTKQFYIGGSKNLYKRWHSHKSHFKAGRNHKQMQALYDLTGDIGDWKMVLIENCATRVLNRREQHYLVKYMNDKKCLNTNHKSFGGRRNVKTDKQGRERLAVSMLGKNTKNGILRPNNLTFISPTGKEYRNIISVKRFAEEHDLSQVQMNHLANGKFSSYIGWTRKGADLPFASNVIEYWSRERMLQNYPEYTIIGPDGTKYKTFVLYHFEQEHNCTVITNILDSATSGVRSNVKGLTDDGRGYRLASAPYFKITYNENVYDNIVSIVKWGKSMGISKKKMQYYLHTNPSMRGPYKIKFRFKVEKIVA